MTIFVVTAASPGSSDPVQFFYDNTLSILTDVNGQRVRSSDVAESLGIEKRNYSVESPARQVSRQTPGGKRNPRILKIQLGLKCNYSCEYCNQRFVPKADDGTPEAVRAFVDSMDAWFKPQEGTKIELWGGEPLVYWKTLQPLVNALHAKYPEVVFSFITNGSLLDAEKNAWIESMPISVSISHDGPGQADRGPDPFDDPKSAAGILDLLRRLLPAGRVSINSMVHKGNASRSEIGAWFQARGLNFTPIGEGAFIDPYDAGGVAMSVPDLSWSRKFSSQAFEEVRSGGAAPFSIVKQKMRDFIESIYNERPADVLGQKCGMDRPDQLAIDMQGNVLTCQNVSSVATAPNGESHNIGHVSKLQDVRLNTSTHWSKRKDCQACPVLQLCHGSCMFLEGPLWDNACNNSWADNLPFFAAAFEVLTGCIPIHIDGPGMRQERRDLWGTSEDLQPDMFRKPFPIPVVSA